MEAMLFKKPAVAVQEESRRAVDHPTGDETVESMKLEAAGELESETSAGSSHFQRSPSPGQKDSGVKKQCDQRESTRAEMGEIREENERLKMMLSRIAKDYQSLRMHFFDIVQQEHAKKPVDQPTTSSPTNTEEESELVSLSLGTSSSSGNKKEDKTNASKDINDSAKYEKCLSLGLEYNYEGSANTSLNETASNRSPDSCFNHEAKEEKPGEAWPPSKVMKNLRRGDEEIAQQQPQVKKARVSIRSRCNAPTMNDGCQWRKYGQKVAKANPCPRAYYRCTVAPSCPVRKQVQRCADDLSILITTYEGTHNHPLPMSATAIASTTSAAASMLLAGSSSSQPLVIDALNSSSASATSATLHGLSFSLSDTSRTRPYYHLQNTSISSTPSYPTITLDLTAQPLSGGSHANQFSRFSTGFANTAPRYTSTNFNFSLSETNSLPLSWSNGSYVNYGNSSSQRYNRSPMGSLSLSRLSQEPFCQSFLEKTLNNVPAVSGSNNHVLTDTIAKALTSDPTFQSALAEAITSYVGTQGAQSTVLTGNACAASFLNRSTNSSVNPQVQANMLCLQPPLAVPGSKSASPSPVDHYRENIN